MTHELHKLKRPHTVYACDHIYAMVGQEQVSASIPHTMTIDSIVIFYEPEAYGMHDVIGAAFGSEIEA